MNSQNKLDPTWDEIVANLKIRYQTVHPLIFLRSVEKAKSHGELFDILELLPKKEMPVIWCSESMRWVVTDDLTLSKDMQFPEVQ
jgi:hypothetical protein